MTVVSSFSPAQRWQLGHRRAKVKRPALNRLEPLCVRFKNTANSVGMLLLRFVC